MKRKAYSSDDLGVSFSLPERLTVRAGLDLRARLADSANDNAYIRWWLAAVPLLEDWDCPDLPDPAALDVDTDATWHLLDIVQYVANQTASHMLELESVPKKQ